MAERATKIEAGRRYAVVQPNGVFHEGDALQVGDGLLSVNGWTVTSEGGVCGMPAWHVTEVAARERHADETTEERHLADVADLGGSLPRLDARRLELRRLHAMERIADALEVMCGVGMDAADAMACGCQAPEDDEVDEEAMQ